MHGFQMIRARCGRRLHRLHRQEVGQEIVLLEEILTYIEEVTQSMHRARVGSD